MRFSATRLALLFIFCTQVIHAISIDREAFTFTKYDLNVQVDPEQQRFGVRGHVTLRNDSQVPQKVAVLQISSSLDWRSIKAGDKPVQFVSQPYTSDIDHTGALSEAIVSLPTAIPPKGTVDLEIAYEGVIVLDATRLTRIGTPEAAAASSDWDQISTKFTAVRGAGYVAWYPIATEVANLSVGSTLFEVLGRWKARETGSSMEATFGSPAISADATSSTFLCGGTALRILGRTGPAKPFSHQCSYQPMGLSVPAFVIANYEIVGRPAITVYNLPEHAASAQIYANAAEGISPFIADWFGARRTEAETADMGEADAAPFESGSLLLTPLTSDAKLAGLIATHQLTHASFSSPRPWINEGLAHFAQALYLEQQKGRQAALEYMGLHRSAFSNVEQPTTAPRSEDELKRALVSTSSEELYRSKAMYVWWMLRDMIGEAALKKAIAAYRPEQDNEASYMPRLIAAQSQRDLQWFCDDWVYHDRGLPDFKVESVFPRKNANGSFIYTITVLNLGAAGAEVPLTVKFAGGEVTKRLEVRGKSRAVIRVDVPLTAQEIVVNDGSVPESDLANNRFKVETNTTAK